MSSCWQEEEPDGTSTCHFNLFRTSGKQVNTFRFTLLITDVGHDVVFCSVLGDAARIISESHAPFSDQSDEPGVVFENYEVDVSRKYCKSIMVYVVIMPMDFARLGCSKAFQISCSIIYMDT